MTWHDDEKADSRSPKAKRTEYHAAKRRTIEVSAIGRKKTAPTSYRSITIGCRTDITLRVLAQMANTEISMTFDRSPVEPLHDVVRRAAASASLAPWKDLLLAQADRFEEHL